MPDRQSAPQCGWGQLMKNTALAQCSPLHPHSVSSLRDGAVKSQQVYSDGLDRLRRIIPMMLDTVGVSPHRIEKPCILLR